MKIPLSMQIAPHYARLGWVLLASNCLSLLLFLTRIAGAENFRYWFMLWNLFLAWLPLVFVLLLTRRLQTRPWRNELSLALTLLWLGFLPNSFYLLSDLIHLQRTGEISVLFDAVMFFSFICNGYIAGYLSVYLIHRELRRRLDSLRSFAIVGAVFLLCGFAIYLGRSLRWNSWDILVNPAGILFDVSEGIINPLAHPQVFVTTITFFLLLSVLYAVLYQLAQVLVIETRRSAAVYPSKRRS